MTSSFHYHYARLIEILFGLEKIAETLEDPEITDPHVRSKAFVNQSQGIGVIEAVCHGGGRGHDVTHQVEQTESKAKELTIFRRSVARLGDF